MLEARPAAWACIQQGVLEARPAAWARMQQGVLEARPVAWACVHACMCDRVRAYQHVSSLMCFSNCPVPGGHQVPQGSATCAGVLCPPISALSPSAAACAPSVPPCERWPPVCAPSVPPYERWPPVLPLQYRRVR